MSSPEPKTAISDKEPELDTEASSNSSGLLYVDPVKEKKLRRKLDAFIIPCVSVIFLLSYIDRSNIGNALSAGLSDDVGLTSSQENTAVTVFYAGYIALQAPAPLIMKRLRASRMIPALLLSWGAVVVATGFVKNFASLCALRVLLGIFEGGIYPCLALLLSHFYLRNEQAQRISYLQISQAISGAFGGLLAAALFKMDGLRNHAGWQWLFIVEGAITMAVAIPCFYLLPDSYEQARWLNEDEKELCRRRSKNTALYHGQEDFSWGEVKRAAFSPRTYLSAAAQFCCNICSLGFGTFLPVIIRAFGYGAIETQLLTVPVYVTATLLYIITAIISDKIQRRTIFMVPLALLTAVGYSIELPRTTPTGVKLFGTFVIGLGIWSNVGLNITILSNTNAGHYKRASALGIQQTLANCAGFLSSNVYRSKDSPHYTLGHAVSLGGILLAGCFYAIQGTTLFYLNKKRDKMSPEERKRLIDENADGDRHPDFRFLW